MTQKVVGPDGVEHEFPDEATPEQMQNALRQHYKIGKPSNVGAMDEFVQGMSLEGADELLGAVSPGMRDRYRAGLKQYEQEHPIRSTAANIAGSMFTPIGAASKGATLTKRAIDAVRAGTIGGSVAGFMGGEGGLEPRSQGAIAGGIMGGAMGGVMAPAAAGAQSVMRYRGDKGVRKVSQALERDATTPEAVRQQYIENQQLSKKPEVVADIAPKGQTLHNTQSLAGVAAGVPGQARSRAQNFLVYRQQGDPLSPTAAGSAANRVGDDAANILAKGDRRSVFRTAEELTEIQKTNSKPAYDALYAKYKTGMWDFDLARLSKRPSIKAAWREAQTMAAEEDRALPEIFTGDDLTLNTEVVPDMQAWDDIKRGLDRHIRNHTENGKVDSVGYDAVNTRRELLKHLDDITNQEYATTRAAYSGPAQSKDALEMGKNILREDVEITRKQIEKLSDSDKLFFQIGVVEAVTKAAALAPNTGSVARGITGRPELRKKLGAAIPDTQDFANFALQLQREEGMLRTFNKTRGSQTAEKLAAIEDADIDITKAAAHLMMGNKITGLGHLTNLWAKLGVKMDEQTANSIGNLLLSDDPKMIMEGLDKVQRLTKARQGSKGVSRSLTVGAGTAGGSQADKSTDLIKRLGLIGR